MAADVVVSRDPDRSGNYVGDGVADDVTIQLAIDDLVRSGVDGKVAIKAGLYTLASLVTIPEDISVEGMGSWATLIRSTTDIEMFSLPDIRSSLSKVGIYTTLDDYTAANAFVTISNEQNKLDDIHFWRDTEFTNVRGTCVRLSSLAQTGDNTGWNVVRNMHMFGYFLNGIHLYNTGVAPDEWVSANKFYSCNFTPAGAVGSTAYRLESTSDGEMMDNIFYGSSLSNVGTGIYLNGSAVRSNGWNDTFMWDMGVGSTNINDVLSEMCYMQGGSINRLRTTTLGATFQMLNVRGYAGEQATLQDRPVPFELLGSAAWVVSAASPTGADIDGTGDGVVGWYKIPEWAAGIEFIRFHGIAQVEEADAMNAKLSFYGRGDNETWDTHATTDTHFPSETTNFVVDDGIYWEADSTKIAQLANVVGGDWIELQFRGQIADGADAATDVLMQSITVYLRGRYS